MTDDSDLLRRYTEEKSEAAFAELVRRYLDLVYAVALRKVGGDAHLAEDVAQQVFADLAKKAAALARHPVLTGWLFTSAHYAATQVVRAEQRRRVREAKAHAMSEIEREAEAAPDWDRLRPLLDDLVHELNERDREAVLLRYFEGRSLAEVGERLEVSAEGARSRVDRAVEKLRATLARRGVRSTAAVLGLALAGQVGVAAPAGLAATVTSGAMAGAAAGAGVAVAGWGAFGLFVGMTKTTVGVVGVAAIVGMGVAWAGVSRARDVRAEMTAATREQAALRAKLDELEEKVQAESKRVTSAEAENARLLAAAKAFQSGAAARAVAEAPITSGMVNARLKRAKELVENGDAAEALREVLWCYDVGMVEVASLTLGRPFLALPLLTKLAERYPPAREVLRERREKARARVLADEGDRDALREFGSLNSALNDRQATLALYDQLPAGDRRRKELASSAFDLLIENRRYQDAASSGSYAVISAAFEGSRNFAPRRDAPDTEAARKEARDANLTWTVKHIEALAGSGDLVNARDLAERLLAHDGAESTRALIQKHAERAGQPGLLAPVVKP